ncbi:hypothetical protein FACS1894105_13740 [Clostridia bacterium]|nr:hypothetical protein FACS1894105_13740 [Clostridia bacterium]
MTVESNAREICKRYGGKLTTREIYIGADANARLLEFIRANYYGKTCCVIGAADTLAASSGLETTLSPALGAEFVTVRLNVTSHHAEEKAVGECVEAVIPRKADFLIAAGSGTIHDITRMSAKKLDIPFISYPTAPSVDGFVSSVAPVTMSNGMKITFDAVAPVAVFADTSVIEDSPARLTASGVGDIIGKYISLADWKIANLLTGEAIDAEIVKYVAEATNRVRDAINRGGAYKILLLDVFQLLVVARFDRSRAYLFEETVARHNNPHGYAFGFLGFVEGIIAAVVYNLRQAIFRVFLFNVFELFRDDFFLLIGFL